MTLITDKVTCQAGVELTTAGDCAVGRPVTCTGATFDVSVTGNITIDSSGGTIAIGGDDIDENISIGTAGDRTIQIGSDGGATGVIVEAGSGHLKLGAPGHDIIIGSSTTGTNTVTIGAVGGINTIQIGTGDATTSVEIKNIPIVPTAVDIIAYNGGGQANATQISAMFNVVATCAAQGDSVKLPATTGGSAGSGCFIYILNRGGQPCTVFPADAGGTIDGSADVDIAVTKGRWFIQDGTTANTWFSTNEV